MSIEAVHGFINKINQDAVLGAMVHRAFADQAEIDLVGLAGQHGFTISQEEGLSVRRTWPVTRAQSPNTAVFSSRRSALA